MKRYTQGLASQKIDYYLSGPKPEFLFFSGLHGDEFEVIDLVKKELKERLGSLPDFLYLPCCSPSAHALKTRHNKEGVDLNRHFFAGTRTCEARIIMSILKPWRVKVAMSWHEDVHEDRFYLYDSGRLIRRDLTQLRRALKKRGIGLLNGRDDPHDECLGFEFRNGYISRVPISHLRPVGSLESYLLKMGIAQRVLGVEVPGRISLLKKKQVVRTIFDYLIPCFLAKKLVK